MAQQTDKLEVWMDYVDGQIMFGVNGQAYGSFEEMWERHSNFRADVKIDLKPGAYGYDKYVPLIAARKDAREKLLKILENSNGNGR